MAAQWEAIGLTGVHLEWIRSEGEVDSGVANLNSLKLNLQPQSHFKRKIYYSEFNLFLPPLPCSHRHPGKMQTRSAKETEMISEIRKSWSEEYLVNHKIILRFSESTHGELTSLPWYMNKY